MTFTIPAAPRRGNPPGWRLSLSDAELASLDPPAPPDPPLSPRRRLWDRIADGLPWLARAGRPDPDKRIVTAILAALVDQEVRDRVMLALAPAIRAIVRDELQRQRGGAA